jgi:transcriptional regulator with XRE-family HTH domain
LALKDRIRELRKAQGLSQEKLARQADLSLNLIGRLEGGQVTDPHYSTLRGLARALGVPVEDLVREPTLAGKAEASEEAGRYEPGDVIISRAFEEGEEPAEVLHETVKEGMKLLEENAKLAIGFSVHVDDGGVELRVGQVTRTGNRKSRRRARA